MITLLAMGCRPASVPPVPSPPTELPASTPGTDTGASVDTAEPSDTGEPTPPEPLDTDAWWRSADEATVDGAAPFDTFRTDLPLEAFAPASQGRELFMASWGHGPGTPALLDGLGPLFHAEACLACHPVGGRALAFAPDGSIGPGLLVRAGTASGSSDPVYGAQLQPRSIDGVQPEVDLGWTEVPASPWVLPDGTTVQRVRISTTIATQQGPLDPATVPTLRLSPQLVGQGLLGAVDQATLAAVADPDDLDGDGVSGRMAMLGTEVGRFGWKATQPTVHAQTAAAFAEDMGITSPLHPDGPCTPSQPACLAQADDPEEVAMSGLEHVSAYLGALGVPGRRLPPSGDPRPAEMLFESIGCAACHRPVLRTAPDAVPSHLADLEIHPYTDLLLHDLGAELAEPVGAGDATGAEWRTPPLWGLRFVEEAPFTRYLHDGRARSLEEAIGWHGGEAAASRDAYGALPVQDRTRLIELLRSL